MADYRRLPPEAVNYLAHQLGLNPVLVLPEPDRPATESAQLARIRHHLGWHEFDAVAEQRLRERLQERAAAGMTSEPLLGVAARFHQRPCSLPFAVSARINRFQRATHAHIKRFYAHARGLVLDIIGACSRSVIVGRRPADLLVGPQHLPDLRPVIAGRTRAGTSVGQAPAPAPAGR